jgi:hypothetical protein
MNRSRCSHFFGCRHSSGLKLVKHAARPFWGGIVTILFLLVSGLPALGQSTNVLTYHNDNDRTGQNLNETTLTTANVNSATFGKLGTITVSGNVDAEPLYVANLTINGATHNVLFVATEEDYVYAFDADTFVRLWRTWLASGESYAGEVDGCNDVQPNVGVTSTPVIDLSAGAHGTIFVVAMTQDVGGNYHQRLHALDLTTGAEQPNSPTTIAAAGTTSYPPFNPMQYKERAGLLLLDGNIYLAWASHCDIDPYQGWVMGYSESSLQQTSVLNITPDPARSTRGSIWMANTAMAADASGNIYCLVANGIFGDGSQSPPLTNGFPTSGDYGNAFLKLSTANETLKVADYFTMFNTSDESNTDEDLGSGGAIVLPDLTDSHGATQHLAVGAGKDGYIYVVNRDSMGKFNPNNDTAIYQKLDDPPGEPALGGPVFSMPAYFNNTVYYGAVNDSPKAFPITNALLSTQPASQSGVTFSFPGCTPSISANGTSNGIVWCILAQNTGTLYAFDAANLSEELYDSNQSGTRDQFPDSSADKFVTPMIANGKVYVGAGSTGGSGSVVVFGLLDIQPTVVSLSPNSGSGVTQTFSVVVNDPSGPTDLANIQLQFNTTQTRLYSCNVSYEAYTNTISLYNDGSTGFAGAVTPGSQAQVSNSQCTLSGTGSSYGTSGDTMTLTVALSFSGATFAGQKNAYVYVQGDNGLSNGWHLEGTWTPAPAQPPTVVSLSPNSGGGATQTFSVVVNDPNGPADLNNIQLQFNATQTRLSSCNVSYDGYTNTISLYNDGGSGFVGTLTPGSSAQVSDSQCTLSGTGSSYSTLGNNITLTVALTFSATFTGQKNAYVYVQGYDGLNSGWQLEGTWTPAPATAPSVVSLTPNSTDCATCYFVVVVNDPRETADLNNIEVLFNTTPNRAGGCDVNYTPATNIITLASDDGTYYMPGMAPTSDGQISNGQCILSGTALPYSVSGNTFTLNVSLYFSPAFTAPQNIYVYVQGRDGLNSGGWVQWGSRTP